MAKTVKVTQTDEAMHNPLYAALVSAALATLMEQTKTTSFMFNTRDELPDMVMVIEQDHDTGEIKISTRSRQWGDE